MAGINRASVGKDFNKHLRESILPLMKRGISDLASHQHTLKTVSSFIECRRTEQVRERQGERERERGEREHDVVGFLMSVSVGEDQKASLGEDGRLCP